MPDGIADAAPCHRTRTPARASANCGRTCRIPDDPAGSAGQLARFDDAANRLQLAAGIALPRSTRHRQRRLGRRRHRRLSTVSAQDSGCTASCPEGSTTPWPARRRGTPQAGPVAPRPTGPGRGCADGLGDRLRSELRDQPTQPDRDPAARLRRRLVAGAVEPCVRDRPRSARADRRHRGHGRDHGRRHDDVPGVAGHGRRRVHAHRPPGAAPRSPPRTWRGSATPSLGRSSRPWLGGYPGCTMPRPDRSVCERSPSGAREAMCAPKRQCPGTPTGALPSTTSSPRSVLPSALRTRGTEDRHDGPARSRPRSSATSSWSRSPARSSSAA